MSQASQLIKTLKKVIKSSGKTYRDIARELDVSESTVKRLFSQESFTLERLEQLCDVLDVRFSDVVRLMEAEQNRVERLTEEQEKLLVSDTRLLVVAVAVLNRWTFEEILEQYAIPENEVIQALAKLDRLKLIDLLPGNRVKLKIAQNFSWRRNGPIQQFFESQVLQDFLRSRFSGKGDLRLFSVGMLSRESNAIMKRKLEQVARQFHELREEDAKLPLKERFGMGMFVAIRPWELRAFEEIRKNDNKRF